jgi:hypothetical protein
MGDKELAFDQWCGFCDGLILGVKVSFTMFFE